MHWVRGIESDLRGGEGPYELPPSCGWPCSVEDKLFLKPREALSFLYHHDLIIFHNIVTYLNLLRIEILYIVVEKRQKTHVADINLVFVWDILCH